MIPLIVFFIWGGETPQKKTGLTPSKLLAAEVTIKGEDPYRVQSACQFLLILVHASKKSTPPANKPTTRDVTILVLWKIFTPKIALI